MKTHYYIVLNHEDGSVTLDKATPHKVKSYAKENYGDNALESTSEEELLNIWCEGYQGGCLSFMEVDPKSSLFQFTFKQLQKDIVRLIK